MKRTQRTVGVFAILVLGLILVGCSSPTVVAQPTQDIPSIKTEAAQTVVAKITIEAALNPTATAALVEAAATETPAPAAATATLEPIPTETTAVTPVPTLTTAPTKAPVVNTGPTKTASPDQALLTSQTPGDGAALRAGEEFDGTWTFKNMGTRTWNTNYYIRYANRGTNLAKAERYYLKDKVEPGDSVTFVSDMVAPSDGGIKVSYWQLCNDNGDVFYSFYTAINVQ